MILKPVLASTVAKGRPTRPNPMIQIVESFLLIFSNNDSSF